jgi:hypothetical protein
MAVKKEDKLQSLSWEDYVYATNISNGKTAQTW